MRGAVTCFAPPSRAFCISGSVGSPSASAHDDDGVLASEFVRDQALGEVIRDPPLAVHDEHVLVGAGGEHDRRTPHPVLVHVFERDRAGAPVVERADHMHGLRPGEAAHELRDALMLADIGTLVPAGEQGQQRHHGGERQAPHRPDTERDRVRHRQPAQQASRPRWNGTADQRHHPRLETRERQRRGEQVRGRREPLHRVMQLSRQRRRRQLPVERLMDPRIDRVHSWSSSTCNSASRARCTRILSVGIRSPVTAAISS